MATEQEHLSFRPATAQDVAAIAEIERLSFDATGERFDEKRVRYLIGSGRMTTLVAHDGQRAGDGRRDSSGRAHPSHGGRVYALAIHPAARGRRLGPKLAQHLIEILRRQGATAIYLEVRTDNHAAIAVYQRLGFEHCKTLHHYYGPGVPAHRMRLPPPAEIRMTKSE